jgi:putative phosphoesterase
MNMRVAVISDIHGNCFALDAVLADIKQRAADQIVCLGDAIQGGPQPAEVVQRLRQSGCPVVMGNADAWLLTGKETGHESISTERQKKLDVVRDWSLEQLNEDDRAFIASFSPTIMIALEAGSNLLCFHGSPVSFDDIILPAMPEEDFQKMLGPFKDNFLCGGHTHAQQIRRIGDRFFFNPGSVGLAYSHHQSEGSVRMDPWAEYALLIVERGQAALDFHRVPFDVERLIQIYHQSGRPFAEDADVQYRGRG